MAEHKKSLVKSSNALTRFDPKGRKELVVRALNALSEVRDADFYFFRGEKHRMSDEIKLAISYYEKALQIDPEHEDSLFWMGYCYMPEAKENRRDDMDLDHPTRYKKAASAFQRLIALREEKDAIWWGDYGSYHNLGIAKDHLGLYEEAIESFEQAIELNPDHANTYYGLGVAQYHLNRYEEAIEGFEQTVELDPDHPGAYYMLGLGQEELGIYHLTLQNFQEYLSHEAPEKTSECIKYARYRVEQLKGLLTDTYFFNIGYRFWKKNEYKQAIECYGRAIELNPDFADAYYNLAIAQEKMAETISSQPVLFDESSWKKSIYELYRAALDNFEKYLRIEDHTEVTENEQFTTYANQQVNKLRELLKKVD